MSWTPILLIVRLSIFYVTCNNLPDYGSQLRNFVRTSEFADDLEEYMDDADFANAGDEQDQEKDEDDYDNEL